jgi:hypothetical protein
MARIIHFPRAARRRFIPHPPAPVRYVVRRRSWVHSGGFGLLLLMTIPAAFLYLSGAVHVARHDTLYAALLAVVWGMYFTSDKLLRTRLGTLLMRAGLLLGFAGIAGFFGFVYWLILSHP